MFSIFRKNKLGSKETMDIIEKNVYEYLKKHGFKKHGRTFHRYVDGDISQVVHLQNSCPSKGVYGVMWVNLGIRVPENGYVVIYDANKEHLTYLEGLAKDLNISIKQC